MSAGCDASAQRRNELRFGPDAQLTPWGQVERDVVDPTFSDGPPTRNRVSRADWLLRLGIVHLFQGEPGPARAALQESLAVSEEIAQRTLVPNILTWLALVAEAEGDLNQAGHYLRKSLSTYIEFYAVDGSHLSGRDVPNVERSPLIEVLLVAARIHAALDSPDSAAILLSFADKVLQERPYQLDPPLQEGLHTQLDLPPLAADRAKGWAMTLEDVIQVAMRTG